MDLKNNIIAGIMSLRANCRFAKQSKHKRNIIAMCRGQACLSRKIGKMHISRRKSKACLAPAILFFTILVILNTCIKPAPFEPQGRKGLSDFKDEVYIINGLAETLSIINCKDLKIYNDVMETGMWPNHLAFKNNKGYLVNSGENNIQVFNEDSLTISYAIDLGVNSNPWMILFGPGTDIAYVPNFVSGNVAVVNVLQKNVVKKIKAGTGPEGCALIGNKLYVANTSWDYGTFDFLQGTVSVIDINTYKVIKTINVDKNPQAVIAFPLRDEVHILCTGNNGGPGSDDGMINIIDTGSDTVVSSLSIGGSPSGFAVDNVSNTVYLSGTGGVQAYNYETRAILNDSGNYLISGKDTENDVFSGIAIDNVYNHIFICNYTYDKIIVLDCASKKKIKEIQGSDGPQTPVFHHE